MNCIALAASVKGRFNKGGQSAAFADFNLFGDQGKVLDLLDKGEQLRAKHHYEVSEALSLTSQTSPALPSGRIQNPLLQQKGKI